MSKPIITIKPGKKLPSVLTVIYVALVVLILLRGDVNVAWVYASAALISILFFALLTDAFTGYLQLNNDSLTKKNLFGSQTIKISEIKEVSSARHILGASQIDIGNARGRVSIVSGAFRRNEFKALMRQLHIKLKSVNPKRAEDLGDILTRY